MASSDTAAYEALERALRTELGWQPSSTALQTMDRRVAAVAATGTRGGFSWPQRRLLALAAIGLLLVGAASAVTLLQQAAELDPRWREAFEEGERINLSQTSAGYTVTIDRAYADPEVLVLAVSLAGPGDTFPAAPQLEVIDEAGREYRDLGGGQAAESVSGASGSIHAFEVPAGAVSPLELTVTVQPLKSEPVTDLNSPPAWFSNDPWQEPMEEPGLVGPWTFHLSLDMRPITDSPSD